MALVPGDDRNPRMAIRNPFSIDEPMPMNPVEFLFSFITLILELSVTIRLAIIGEFVGKGVL